jgi:hypothetical protein
MVAVSVRVRVMMLALAPVGLGTLPIDLIVQTLVTELKLAPYVAVAVFAPVPSGVW